MNTFNYFLNHCWLLVDLFFCTFVGLSKFISNLIQPIRKQILLDDHVVKSLKVKQDVRNQLVRYSWLGLDLPNRTGFTHNYIWSYIMTRG